MSNPQFVNLNADVEWRNQLYEFKFFTKKLKEVEKAFESGCHPTPPANAPILRVIVFQTRWNERINEYSLN